MNELLKTLAKELRDKEYAHAYMSEQANMRLAAQVRALRLQRGWTQQKLARLSGMAQVRISKIENADFGSLTLSTLRKLAEAFDVHVMATFVPFSAALLDFVALSPEWLQCKSREEDLTSFEAIYNVQGLLAQTDTTITVGTDVMLSPVRPVEYSSNVTLLTIAGNSWQPSNDISFSRWDEDSFNKFQHITEDL